MRIRYKLASLGQCKGTVSKLDHEEVEANPSSQKLNTPQQPLGINESKLN